VKYSLHPEALQDLREAASFYSEKAGGTLAQAVIAEFEHAIDLLLRFPGLGAMWRHGKRRVLMRRFPYSVVYAVEGDEIRILAVAHHSRRPGYWRARK
jgi:plasmid stabilization system protein ParE